MNQPQVLTGKQVDAIRKENDRLRREVEALRQALWDCFAAAGGITDDQPTPQAVGKELAGLAVDAVREMGELLVATEMDLRDELEGAREAMERERS